MKKDITFLTKKNFKVKETEHDKYIRYVLYPVRA